MLRCASHYCCHPEDVISPETVSPFDDRLFKSVSHRSIDLLVVVVVGAWGGMPAWRRRELATQGVTESKRCQGGAEQGTGHK